MIHGQKVVKVFNHESTCKEEFDKLNEELCHNAYTAGKLTNMMGPVNNNLGYIQYTILAIVGGYVAIASNGNLLTFVYSQIYGLFHPIKRMARNPILYIYDSLHASSL